MIDLLITGGTILDGSGDRPFEADVAVTGGLISDIGNLKSAQAAECIQAHGKIVSPGFIDVHSHSDAYILLAPEAESKITQGITTEITGNCGASAAPLTGEARLPSDWAAMQYPVSWRTVAEYRTALESARPAVNIKMLTGHNTLRGGVLGYRNVKAAAADLNSMVRTLNQAMDEGSSGLSTGLLYAPGMFAGEDEIVELCRVVAERDGIYTSHMRSEGARLIEAIEETLRIAEKSGVRTQISHLKTSGKNNWGLLEKALDLIHSAREKGLDIAADRYPYTSACTDLDVLLPDFAAEGTREEILARLADNDFSKKVVENLKAARQDEYWKSVTVGSVTEQSLVRFQGTPLTEVAQELDMHPAEAVVYLVSRDLLRTSAFFAGMSEDNMLRILAEPYVMIGTDASLRTSEGLLSRDYPHPRAFGSFPRYLRMVLDKQFLSLAEAVRKVTSLPAKQFSMSQRGILRQGNIADITVFSPDQITDKAAYSAPRNLSQGVDYVIVNGVIAMAGGRLTGRRAGQFIA